MAKGEYRMVGQKVIVTVTDKHWLLPWPVVEAQLKSSYSSLPIARVESAARPARRRRTNRSKGDGPRRQWARAY